MRTGSIERRDRSRIGVQWDIVGSTMLWSIVGINKGEGQKYDGRAWRLYASERLASEVGVKMSLGSLV